MTRISSLDVSLDDWGDVLVRPHEQVNPCLRLRPYEWDRFLFELACYLGERSKLTREPHRIRREYELDSRFVLGGNMRKALASLAAAVAVAVPLALAGTASASTAVSVLTLRP